MGPCRNLVKDTTVSYPAIIQCTPEKKNEKKNEKKILQAKVPALENKKNNNK